MFHLQSVKVKSCLSLKLSFLLSDVFLTLYHSFFLTEVLLSHHLEDVRLAFLEAYTYLQVKDSLSSTVVTSDFATVVKSDLLFNND